MKNDLTGKSFNKLTALRFDHKGRHGLSFYVFKCECGVEKAIRGTDVSSGKTKSCGCNRYTCKKSHTLPVGIAAFNSLYLAYKSNARSRGLDFELTKQEFSELTTKPCKYCGVEPYKYWKGGCGKLTPYVYNGVDRLENSVGYIRSNSVPCCCICNKAKHAMSLSDFMAWIERITKFNSKL